MLQVMFGLATYGTLVTDVLATTCNRSEAVVLLIASIKKKIAAVLYARYVAGVLLNNI